MKAWNNLWILVFHAIGSLLGRAACEGYNYSNYAAISYSADKLHELLLDTFDPLSVNSRVKRNPFRFDGPSTNYNSGPVGAGPGPGSSDPGPVSLYYAYQPVPATSNRLYSGNGELYYTEEQKEQLLQNALDSAWEQYGPKTKPKIPSNQISSGLQGQGQGQLQSSPLSSTYAHRDTSGAYAYDPNSGFQPWQSEWDTHVTALPPPVRPIMEPSFFNRLMASYIDFEVNNHEMSDFLRRAVAFGFIGLCVIAWIGLGIYLGLFPLKWLYFLGVGRKRDAEGDERLDTSGGKLGNELMSEITDRVFLALDGDWLRKLEEHVTNDENRSWLKTHVQCCILPDAKTKGMADCQLVRRARKDSTFKCLSDLIYNFQFNPTSPPPGISRKSNSDISNTNDLGNAKTKNETKNKNF